MSGCWWQCMESTPRVEKTFLSRERATFLTSSNKVHTLEKSWWWNKITLYLDNEELLEQFINNEEPKYFNKEKRSKRKRAEEENEEFEPEEAFLKIGSNLRQVLLLSFTVSPSIPFPCWVWFIPDLGAEAPAAIGDAPGHRGKTWRHLLHQSQHWIRCGGPVKVKRAIQCFDSFLKISKLTEPISVLKDCCCMPLVPTMRSTRTALTLVAGDWLELRTPGESKLHLEIWSLPFLFGPFYSDLSSISILHHTWIPCTQVQRKRPKACRVPGDEIKGIGIETKWSRLLHMKEHSRAGADMHILSKIP